MRLLVLLVIGGEKGASFSVVTKHRAGKTVKNVVVDN